MRVWYALIPVPVPTHRKLPLLRVTWWSLVAQYLMTMTFPCAQVAVAWVRLFAVPRPLPADSPGSTISEGRIMQHVEALAHIPGGRGVRGPAPAPLQVLCCLPAAHT